MEPVPFAAVLLVAAPVVIASFLGIIAIAEVGHRRLLVPAEVTRTSAHVGCAVVAALLPLVLGRWAIVALGAGFAVLMAVSRRHQLLLGLHGVERRTWGEVAFPLGLVLPEAAGLPAVAYAAGALVLGIGDSAAGVIGRRWGRHGYRSWGGSKSLEGSIAMWVVTALVASLVLAAYPPTPGRFVVAVVVTATVCSAVEAALGYGLDNLALPLVASLTLVWTSGTISTV